MLIKNARIVVKDNDTKVQDILIKNKKIARIADYIEYDGEYIDVEESLLFPGGIDVHVHLREPGHTEKETIDSGTRAALRGGYTTIMAMPNVIPFPDTVDVIKEYQTLIEKNAHVHVLPYACITMQEAGHHIVDMKRIKAQGIDIFSDDGVGVQSDAQMEAAMELAYQNDAMIVAHTEDMNYRRAGACMHEGKRNKELNLVGIPSECEFKQVERDLALAKKTNVKYHICHISAKESVDALRTYKALGADVSGEVTTHHLLLSEEDVNNPNDKMNPPLRSIEDRQALIDGLMDGTIDFIANDHAPHTEEEKSRAMDKAPFGIVALETSLPLLYTNFVDTGIFTLEMLQDYISRKPAQRFGLTSKGEIKEGYDADFFCLHQAETKIDKRQFVSKGKNTPFDGYPIKAAIAMTMVDGIIKWNTLGGNK